MLNAGVHCREDRTKQLYELSCFLPGVLKSRWLSFTNLSFYFLSKKPLRVYGMIFNFRLLICTKMARDLWFCEMHSICKTERAFIFSAVILCAQLALFPISGSPILWSIASNGHQILRGCIYLLFHVW